MRHRCPQLGCPKHMANVVVEPAVCFPCFRICSQHQSVGRRLLARLRLLHMWTLHLISQAPDAVVSKDAARLSAPSYRIAAGGHCADEALLGSNNERADSCHIISHSAAVLYSSWQEQGRIWIALSTVVVAGVPSLQAPGAVVI